MRVSATVPAARARPPHWRVAAYFDDVSCRPPATISNVAELARQLVPPINVSWHRSSATLSAADRTQAAPVSIATPTRVRQCK